MPITNLNDEQLYKVEGIPIFEAGVWKGGKLNYPMERLQQIVESYAELKGRIVPYIFLGHGPDGTQKHTGQPNVGRLENVRLQGNRIVADLAALPKQIYEMLKRGAYNRWSVEIAKDWLDTLKGKTHERLLTGMALLGTEQPAVNTLPVGIADYSALYYSENLDIQFDLCDSEIKVNEGSAETITVQCKIVDQLDEGGESMDEKEVQALRDELAKANKKLEAAEQANEALSTEKQTAVDKAQEQVDALNATIKERENKDRAAKITDFLSEFKEQGKLLPAQEDIYRERLDRASDLDKEMKAMEGMFKAMPTLVDIDAVRGDDGDHASEGDKDQARKKYAAEIRHDIAALGYVGKADDKDIDEFADVAAHSKPGERASAMTRSRQKLADDINKSRPR
ncbi:MAG TPA: hypothetical protein VII85_00365 [Candidatus Krumholzibacteriaceae bacterium]